MAEVALDPTPTRVGPRRWRVAPAGWSVLAELTGVGPSDGLPELPGAARDDPDARRRARDGLASAGLLVGGEVAPAVAGSIAVATSAPVRVHGVWRRGQAATEAVWGVLDSACGGVLVRTTAPRSDDTATGAVVEVHGALVRDLVGLVAAALGLPTLADPPPVDHGPGRGGTGRTARTPDPVEVPVAAGGRPSAWPGRLGAALEDPDTPRVTLAVTGPAPAAAWHLVGAADGWWRLAAHEPTTVTATPVSDDAGARALAAALAAQVTAQVTAASATPPRRDAGGRG
ncbi:MAG: hypothetical protein ACLGIR_09270 [Actinomycetes bacterium]